MIVRITGVSRVSQGYRLWLRRWPNSLSLTVDRDRCSLLVSVAQLSRDAGGNWVTARYRHLTLASTEFHPHRPLSTFQHPTAGWWRNTPTVVALYRRTFLRVWCIHTTTTAVCALYTRFAIYVYAKDDLEPRVNPAVNPVEYIHLPRYLFTSRIPCEEN